MRSLLIILIAISLLGVLKCNERWVPGWIGTEGEIWPKPQQQITSEDYLLVNPETFQFVSNETCELLVKAFERYQNVILITANQLSNINKLEKDFSGYLHQLNVNIVEPCQDGDLPTDSMVESYSLIVDTTTQNAEINSQTIWGAMRGLESFSQMLVITFDGTLRINGTEIMDFPRFSHRGFLMDTARHFMPIPLMLKNFEAMEYNKMNVLHWHLVDDHSFPFQSVVYPELSNKGAYHPKLVYSPSDVREIIEYARQRGIRIIPEFDTPGHTRSWGLGYPDILTGCYNENGVIIGPIDPTRNTTYKFMENLFRELVEVFPDHYIHIGGDEVDFSCWETNQDILDFMNENGFSNVKEVEGFYVQKIVDIVDNLDGRSVVWEEVFTDGVVLPENTIVQVWKEASGLDLLSTVTAAGYPAIFSGCWYLNFISYGRDWEAFYECDPHDFDGDEQQMQLVLGGEACLWAEWVDLNNLLQRTWPRASIIAEKLWSAKDADTIENVRFRLEEHTCRMNVRGIPANPPNGPGFCLAQYNNFL